MLGVARPAPTSIRLWRPGGLPERPILHRPLSAATTAVVAAPPFPKLLRPVHVVVTPKDDGGDLADASSSASSDSFSSDSLDPFSPQRVAAELADAVALADAATSPSAGQLSPGGPRLLSLAGPAIATKPTTPRSQPSSAHRRPRKLPTEREAEAAGLGPRTIVAAAADPPDLTCRAMANASDVIEEAHAHFELPGMLGETAGTYIQVVDLLPEHMPPLDEAVDGAPDEEPVAKGTADASLTTDETSNALEPGDMGWRHMPPAEWGGKNVDEIVAEVRDAELGGRLAAMQRAMARLEEQADQLEEELGKADTAVEAVDFGVGARELGAHAARVGLVDGSVQRAERGAQSQLEALASLEAGLNAEASRRAYGSPPPVPLPRPSASPRISPHARTGPPVRSPPPLPPAATEYPSQYPASNARSASQPAPTSPQQRMEGSPPPSAGAPSGSGRGGGGRGYGRAAGGVRGGGARGAGGRATSAAAVRVAEARATAAARARATVAAELKEPPARGGSMGRAKGPAFGPSVTPAKGKGSAAKRGAGAAGRGGGGRAGARATAAAVSGVLADEVTENVTAAANGGDGGASEAHHDGSGGDDGSLGSGGGDTRAAGWSSDIGGPLSGENEPYKMPTSQTGRLTTRAPSSRVAKAAAQEVRSVSRQSSLLKATALLRASEERQRQKHLDRRMASAEAALRKLLGDSSDLAADSPGPAGQGTVTAAVAAASTPAGMVAAGAAAAATASTPAAPQTVAAASTLGCEAAATTPAAVATDGLVGERAEGGGRGGRRLEAEELVRVGVCGGGEGGTATAAASPPREPAAIDNDEASSSGLPAVAQDASGSAISLRPGEVGDTVAAAEASLLQRLLN